ncbi:hypothetical protein WDV76_11760 [Xenorhabdus griffiniae]
MPKSGLRFVCRIGNLPENTFAVADFIGWNRPRANEDDHTGTGK